MTDDYIVFLSGAIPHGVTILFAVLILVATIWLFVWRGTNFWSVRYYWNILARIYFVIIVAYIVFWLNNRPHPIPIRIIVVQNSFTYPQSASWQVVAARTAIQQHLYYSAENYVLITGQVSKSLQKPNLTRESIEYLAAQMRVRWIVYLEERTSEQNVRVDVTRYRWLGYESKKSISANITNYRTAQNLADNVSKIIGEKGGSSAANGLSLPVTSQADYFRALNLLNRDASDSAFTMLEALVEKHPDCFELRRDLAKCRLTSRPEFYRGEIKWHLTEALGLRPDDSEVLLMLGKVLLQFRQWDEAESALKLSYSINNDDPRLYLFISRLAISRIGDLGFEKTEEPMRHAIYLAPGYDAARLALAQLKVGQLKKREALRILNEGLAIDSSSQSILLSKTAVLIELNQNTEAAMTCNRILSQNPINAGALYNMGIILLWQKAFDRALAMFDSSLDNGGTVDNYYYKGVAYQQMEDWEAAVREFQRRLANPMNAQDRAAISARERVKMLRLWIAQRDST